MTTLRCESAVVRKAGLLLAVLAVLSIVSCNSGQQAPVADTRAADEAAVRKADADWVKAAQTKRVEDWVAFYADDAVVLPPNDKTATGKDSIRKIINDLLGLPNLSVSWTPTKAEAAKSGDLAYLYGTYRLSFTGPDGKLVDDHGKTLEIWKKRADGNWKCIVDTWSSDLPVAAPAK
jgi:ketosteroid isomerase-like protein